MILKLDQCQPPHRNPYHVGERNSPVMKLQSLQVFTDIWWEVSVYLSPFVLVLVLVLVHV